MKNRKPDAVYPVRSQHSEIIPPVEWPRNRKEFDVRRDGVKVQRNAMMNVLKNPFGADLPLHRYPERKHELLQAWDAADELLLDHVATLAPGGKKILILGDSFGAISAALAEFHPTTYVDSYLGARGMAINTQGKLKPLSRLKDLTGAYDLIFIRIPKNMSFFEDELAHVSRLAKPGALLVAGYMVKHQANSAFDLIAKYFGETTTSLARKKARLIFATFARSAVDSPYPLSVPMEGFPEPFVNHSNVFSREKLDIGTRFFLEHLPKDDFKAILDLGCGNGAIGIGAKLRSPAAKVTFTDESQMAVLSAEENFGRCFPGAAGDGTFLWTNGIENGADESFDLVLCNPPFHQGNAVGDFVAREMFKSAHRVLRPGGLLRIIGNSHLLYGEELRHGFGNAALVAKNAKFTVIDSRKLPH